MASPHLGSAHHAAAQARRYRRSAFNGAKQLAAVGAPQRRVLAAVSLLALLLVAALTVVAVQLAGGPH